MPDERVPDQIHFVAEAETDESVRWGKVIAVAPFARVDELPFQIILGADLVELLLEQGNIFRILLRRSAEACTSRDHAAIHRRAHQKSFLEGVLQRHGPVCCACEWDRGK